MNKKTYFELLILVLVFILGISLRLYLYLLNVPFYPDENLALPMLKTKTYIDLIFPLHAGIAMPFLFLMLSKFFGLTFGMNEFVLRAVPFLSSLGSLFAFYFLSKKVFDRFWVRVLALLLFAINLQLLYYSQFFRPYSSDVLFCLLTLLIAFSIDLKKISFKQAFGLGILSSVAFCFSFPMLFSVSGIMLVYLFFSKEFKKIFLFLLPNFITLITYFFICIRQTSAEPLFNFYWAFGFHLGSKLFKINFDSLFAYLVFSHLFVLFLFAGIIWAYKTNKFKALILVSPIAITLVAAYFKIYPFAGRLILFLVPLFIFLALIPLDKISLEKKFLNIATIAISLILWINYFVNFSADFLFQSFEYCSPDVKKIVTVLKKEKSDDEPLYVYFAPFNFHYYLYQNLTRELPKKGGLYRLDIDSLPLIKHNDKYLYKHAWFLFVGNLNTYGKPVYNYSKWLHENMRVKQDLKLKSARLIEVSLE